MSDVVKTSTITIRIGLDAEKMPTAIDWQAEDGPSGPTSRSCKAMLLALFDEETMDTFKIDLWTKEMKVSEMDRFFYQNLKSMADTYFRATQNTELANEMQKFAQYFGEETEIIPKPDNN
ncbi:MAG: gliding motility protein GldC [Bacteroidota bacterium]